MAHNRTLHAETDAYVNSAVAERRVDVVANDVADDLRAAQRRQTREESSGVATLGG